MAREGRNRLERNAIVHVGRLDAGVELLTKPFTQVALAARLRDILDAKRSPGRILVVEDESMIQMLAADYLSSAGFQVETAGSATEAMNKMGIMRGGFDAAVVDIGLPDKTGDDLIHEIRSMYSSLPVVLATGRGAAEIKQIFKNEEKIAYVTKPYLADDLLNALRTLGIRGKAQANSVSESSAERPS